MKKVSIMCLMLTLTVSVSAGPIPSPPDMAEIMALADLPRSDCNSADHFLLAEKLIQQDTSNSAFGDCLALFNGLRLGEVLNLKKTDVDLRNNTIKIRGKSESMHGTEFREIPLHPYNIDLLQTLPFHTGMPIKKAAFPQPFFIVASPTPK